MEARITYSGRIAYMDTTRVIAILAVILLHCSTMFLDASQSSSFVLGSILNSVSRFGVPCFVMISGALFLDENRAISIRSVFGKYVKGIIWLIVIWNIIFAIAYTIILPYIRWGGNPLIIRYLQLD